MGNVGLEHLMCDERGRVDVRSLTLAQLESWLVQIGEAPFRGLQIWQALWQRGARQFAEMPHISRSVQETLSKHGYIAALTPHTIEQSEDGTTKYLWQLEDGHTIESVLIPDGQRTTLCLSSQVGCAMACSFCLTGDLGLIRQLKPSEIANQALQVGRGLPDGKRITNLVFMGMGEPLHNLDNVCSALEICLDDRALNFSHRRVTVSTVGLVPGLRTLASRFPVNIAVSVNSADPRQREQLMPITRRWSLDEVLETCRELPLPSGKRITFGYVLFDGVNDGLDDAERLWERLQGLPAKVNLIPYNANPNRDLRAPPFQRIKAFQHYFVSRGMHCAIRTPRGEDISAACGQLGRGPSETSSRDARSVS